MFSEEEKERYSRHFLLQDFGEDGQQKLKNARVLVIGAGGLGCPALQYLAAAGVGTIGIVDGDEVGLSNLHRQILYTNQDIGQNKAVVASYKLQQINPHITTEVFEEFLNIENALDIIDQYDVVLDGSDNFEARYLVNDACVILGKPFVYGAILKFEGQVSVFNYQDGPTYRCLFPEPPKGILIPNCAEVGVIGVLPGLIGSYQANEAIKIITGIGNTLSGRLLMIDALQMSHHSIQIKLVPENKQISDLKMYEVQCGSSGNLVTPAEVGRLLEQADVAVLDVRTDLEFQKDNIGGLNIPLASLEEQIHQLDKDKSYLVICQSGVRSRQAINTLNAKGFHQLYDLKGGLNAYRMVISASLK